MRSGPLLASQFTWKDFKFAPLPDTVFEAVLEATPPAFEAMVRKGGEVMVRGLMRMGDDELLDVPDQIYSCCCPLLCSACWYRPGRERRAHPGSSVTERARAGAAWTDLD